MSLLDKMLEENAENEYEAFWSWSKDYEVVQSEIIDQRRWVTVWEDVVTHEDFPDEFVRVNYELGSTEMQEAELNADFVQVYPQEVTVVQYIARDK